MRDKVEEHSKELAEMRGNLHQLDKIIGATVRQSIWQLIAVIVTLLVAIGGGLAYQTSSIDKRIAQMERSSNTRFEMIEKQIEQSDKNFGDRFEQLEKRIEQSDKNMAARFEDLAGSPRAAQMIFMQEAARHNSKTAQSPHIVKITCAPGTSALSAARAHSF